MGFLSRPLYSIRPGRDLAFARFGVRRSTASRSSGPQCIGRRTSPGSRTRVCGGRRGGAQRLRGAEPVFFAARAGVAVLRVGPPATGGASAPLRWPSRPSWRPAAGGGPLRRQLEPLGFALVSARPHRRGPCRRDLGFDRRLVHEREPHLVADRVVGPDLGHADVVVGAEPFRDFDRPGRHVEPELDGQTAVDRPLGHRLEGVDRFLGLDLDDTGHLAARARSA